MHGNRRNCTDKQQYFFYIPVMMKTGSLSARSSLVAVFLEYQMYHILSDRPNEYKLIDVTDDHVQRCKSYIEKYDEFF